MKTRLLSLLLVMISVLLPAKLWAADGTPEPYAVLTGDTLLTFYFDDQKAARGGVDINDRYISTSSSSPYGSATTAVFDASFANYRPTSTAFWFDECSSLTSFTGMENLKTDNVTDMNGMFSGCEGLTGLNLASFNTANVTDMANMFNGCFGLTSLDVTNFNTANVTNMAGMFGGCIGLTSLDLSNFNTQNVTEMGSMFVSCSGLRSLDLSNFNTQNVTGMNDMFAGCEGLTSLNLSNLNTANVTSMTQMFYVCSNLTSLDLSSFNTANVTDMSSMFSRCSSLTSLDLSNFNTANVTNMHSMFHRCTALTSLNVSSFNTANVTVMQDMFSSCPALASLDLSNFNTANVTDMQEMFNNCQGLTALDLSSFNTGNVTKMGSMFEQCEALTTVNVSSFNTANVTDLCEMFRDCTALTSVDISNFNTQNVTDMSQMFDGCSNLVTIYAGNEWSTYSVQSGNRMFYLCEKLVGGAGTVFDVNHIDHTYAHIDGGTANPGYFTDKNAPVGIASFDGYTAIVSGERTLDEAFEQGGGRTEAAKTIAAIVWNKETSMTQRDLQSLDNPNLLVYVNEASQAPSSVQNVVINGLASEIVLVDAEDNNNFYVPQAFTAERISYTRNFGQTTQVGVARGWESIALPFNVQTIEHETKGVIAPFGNNVSNKHFWLRRLGGSGLQAANGIEANTPYVISMPNSSDYTDDYNLAGRVTFRAQNTIVPATVTKATALADSSIAMLPAMQRVDRSSAVWALNVGEVRGRYLEGSVFERDYRQVRPFEAYTVHREENSHPAPRYVPIMEIGGVTGIETIDHSPLTNDQWYDLNGRKLQGKPKAKGVYIDGNRKVVVR